MMETLQQTFERLSNDQEAFEREVTESTRIDKDDVYAETMTHAEEYARWALLAAIAEDVYVQFDTEVDFLKLDCAKLARDQLSAGGVKVTEDRVKEVAGTMPILKQAMEAKNRAYIRWQKFRAVAFAMSQRKDMLQSANARQRVELNSYSQRDPEPPKSLDDVKAAYARKKSTN